MEKELILDLGEARQRFDETCHRLRPELHRFCTRMIGSPCDGEDVLQEVLVLAFYRLAELRDASSLRSWLFRIAHNKCIDFLRSRRAFEPIHEQFALAQERAPEDSMDDKTRAGRTLTHILTALPPKERACVILKDVLDCSLEETAEMTDSNVGAVKAALSRAREKLEAAERTPRVVPLSPRRRALIERYLAAFNRLDWAEVRALLADDARLEVVHRSEGAFTGDSYFGNYSRIAWTWKLALAWVDGVESVVHFQLVDGEWLPRAVVEVQVAGGRVSLVRDYVHVEYMLEDCVVNAPQQ